MSNVIIDIILILIVVFGAIWGISRGFIKSVSGPVKFFACIIIAFGLCSFFAETVIAPIIEEPLTNQISDYLVENFEENEDGEPKIPTLVRFAAVVMDVNIDEIEGVEGYAQALADKIAHPVISLVSSIAAFVILYFLAKLLVAILFKILDSMLDSGVAGSVNKILGCVFSTFLALVVAWAAATLFEFVINAPAFENVAWMNEFDGGYIYKFLKTLNPIDLLFSF